jgi:putative membrane protein
MVFIIDIIKGMLVGIANIIPGVSGGTMAVSLGIYSKLLDSISHLFKQCKKSIITLLPIVIGVALGIGLFSYTIEYLLAYQPFATCMAFIGLILGGVPIILVNLKADTKPEKKNALTTNIIVFLLFLALAIILPMLGGSKDSGVVLQSDFFSIIKLFLIGVIASSTMVIPGVSGSLVLMILGYYFGILNAVTNFIDALKSFDIDAIFNLMMILIPFGIGVVLGIFAIAKLIEWLLQKYYATTYSAILGLIIASPFAIIYKVGFGNINPLNFLTGIILFIIGAVITYKLGKMQE